MPGFSAIVSNTTLRENDYNLNIRRYADNAPPPEPHDVRAHLLGKFHAYLSKRGCALSGRDASEERLEMATASTGAVALVK